MCVILNCKPFKRPTDELIESCWNSNPDGAGFMYPENGEVHGFKGFMDLPSLMDALGTAPEDVPLCIHFRIGTSGGDDERVTHPYPITDDLDALHATEWTAPYGLAHNGVLHNMWTDDENGVSDTVAYLMDIVAPLMDACVNEGIPTFCNDVVATALEQTSIGSRLLVMGSDGEVFTTGRGWNRCADGITASNNSWAYGVRYAPARGSVAWKVA